MRVLKQEYVPEFPISDLVPDELNPWRGDDHGVGEAIDALGFYGAVLVQAGSNRLIAGHTRRRKAVDDGQAWVPALVVDVDDETARRMLVNDNVQGQRGRFDDDALHHVLGMLKATDRGLSGSGFGDDDLAAVVKRLDKAARATHARSAVRPAETPEGTAEVIQGDARVLDGIADESVDLIVTSPPYFALRSYRDGGEHYEGQIGSEPSPEEWLEAMWECTATWWAKLKSSGSLWVNLGDKYAGTDARAVSRSSQFPTADYQPASTRQRTADEFAIGDPHTEIRTNVRPKSLIGVPWRYAIGCIDGRAAPDGQRWILRAEVIWHKVNSLPESVTDRVRRSHEQWFHLVKSERYYAAIDEVREQHGDETDPAEYEARKNGGWPFTDVEGAGRHEHGAIPNMPHPLGRVPGSVWSIPSEPLVVPDGFSEHFAAFPQEWPRRIILGWSPSAWCDGCGEPRRPVVDVAYSVDAGSIPSGTMNEGRHNTPSIGGRSSATVLGYECACDDPDAPTSRSVVLDPFGGTGTTAMVARALGRHGVSVDLSADYCRLAKWRIFESGHWQKTLDRVNGQHDGNEAESTDTP